MIFVLQDGEEIGRIEGEEIHTKDVTLDSLFYQLIDEGVPQQKRPGVVSYQESTPERIAAFLQTQGYEARNGERETQDAKEDPAVIKNINFQGLRVAVENLRGDVRHGATFHQKMTAPYGYIQRTEGVDGDAVDCFLGAVLDSPWVYVIHSRNKWGEYDEDKVMLGFENEDTARQCFLDNYDHPEFFGGIEKFTMTDFKYKLQALKGKKITS